MTLAKPVVTDASSALDMETNDVFADDDSPEFGKALATVLPRAAKHLLELATAGIDFAMTLVKVGPAAAGLLLGSISRSLRSWMRCVVSSTEGGSKRRARHAGGALLGVGGHERLLVFR